MLVINFLNDGGGEGEPFSVESLSTIANPIFTCRDATEQFCSEHFSSPTGPTTNVESRSTAAELPFNSMIVELEPLPVASAGRGIRDLRGIDGIICDWLFADLVEQLSVDSAQVAKLSG